jgi:hypothetical protein
MSAGMSREGRPRVAGIEVAAVVVAISLLMVICFMLYESMRLAA